MPIVGNYPKTYINFKGETVKRPADTSLPKLGLGMDFERYSRTPGQTKKYNKKPKTKQ